MATVRCLYQVLPYQ